MKFTLGYPGRPNPNLDLVNQYLLWSICPYICFSFHLTYKVIFLHSITKLKDVMLWGWGLGCLTPLSPKDSVSLQEWEELSSCYFVQACQPSQYVLWGQLLTGVRGGSGSPEGDLLLRNIFTEQVRNNTQGHQHFQEWIDSSPASILWLEGRTASLMSYHLFITK